MTTTDDEQTFNIEVTMKERWVPHFLAMLEKMEHYGDVGSSRNVGIYSDGDGDFRPKFQWDKTLPSDVQPDSEYRGNVVYDAG